MTEPSAAPQFSGVPPILARGGPLLQRYDVMLCDVWGVVHDGHRAYRTATHALKQFRDRGGTVILVSNAPVPAGRVAEMLDTKAVPRHSYDAIVTSGDIALAHIAQKAYRALYRIGPQDRDAAFFDRLPSAPAALEAADAIVCTGLDDDILETAESYRPLLEEALTRRLPFVCANPDLVVDVGGRLYPCAGAIAALYEDMGGAVDWCGKPHESAYGTALATAARVRGKDVERARVIAVGDAVRTDLEAARRAGVDAVFIAAGIHRHDTMDGEAIVPARLAELFPPHAPRALAAMPMLAW
jgi:HAD superfamily hydrolase (TIGR01459 family)